jgi:N-acetyltransferase
MAIVNKKSTTNNNTINNNNNNSTINRGKISSNEIINNDNDNDVSNNHDIKDCNTNTTNNNSDIDDNIKKNLGIRQIWVNKNYRRQGIAEKMIDAARKCFTFGTIIDRTEIAFSQPTSDGLAFALAYTNSLNILAYS